MSEYNVRIANPTEEPPSRDPSPFKQSKVLCASSAEGLEEEINDFLYALGEYAEPTFLQHSVIHTAGGFYHVVLYDYIEWR